MSKKTEQQYPEFYDFKFTGEQVNVIVAALNEGKAKTVNPILNIIGVEINKQESAFTELNKKPIEVGKPIKKNPDGANNKDDNVKKFPKK